jgi:hypothetical protein
LIKPTQEAEKKTTAGLPKGIEQCRTVATVVTALAVKATGWINADSKLSSLADVIDESNKSIQALEAWVKACKAVDELPEDDAKTKARESAIIIIERLKDKISKAGTEVTITAAGSSVVDSMKFLVILLRLRPPAKAWVWLPQVLFYFSFSLAVVLLVLPRRDVKLFLLFLGIALLISGLCRLLEKIPGQSQGKARIAQS